MLYIYYYFKNFDHWHYILTLLWKMRTWLFHILSRPLLPPSTCTNCCVPHPLSLGYQFWVVLRVDVILNTAKPLPCSDGISFLLLVGRSLLHFALFFFSGVPKLSYRTPPLFWTPFSGTHFPPGARASAAPCSVALLQAVLRSPSPPSWQLPFRLPGVGPLAFLCLWLLSWCTLSF